MTSAVAQSWLDTAAFQVQDKRRILAEICADPDASPELLLKAGTLVLLTQVMLMKATQEILEEIAR